MAGVRKVGGRKSRALISKRRYRDLLPPIDICGHLVRVVEDNAMSEYALAMIEDSMIKLKTVMDGERVSYWWLLDAFLHELLHFWIELSGLGYQARRRIKMRKTIWREFEEEFLVRPLTPTIMATLLRADLLKLPALPGKPRHRKSRRVLRSSAKVSRPASKAPEVNR